MGKLSEPSPITPLAFTHVLWFIIYINVQILYEILYDSTTTGFHKPTTNYLLTLQLKRCSQRATNVQPTMQLTIQPTCSQCAIAKRNFLKFRLRSTNSLFKPNQINEPLDHQRLKGIKFIVCSPRVNEPIRFH